MTNSNPVSWFDIHVSNFDRAKKFYETVFNFKLFDAPTEWGKQAFFPFNQESTNISGALVEKADMTQSANNTIVYFVSSDCITEEKRIEEAGGKVVRPKMSIGEFGFISIFIDTEGNTVGMHSRS
jgi:uncharacterized protein